MPAYGKIKVDTITYDLSGTATDVPVSTIAVDSDLALKADLSGATFTGQINGTSLVLNNDLTVNGTLTYLNSTDLEITDKNIIIGKVSTPSDATADLGGITLKGATDKEIKWVNATDAWTFSEHIELASGKTFIGDGSTITALNGSNISTGTVADARISTLTASKLTGALPAISGANLTNLPPAGNTVDLVADGAIAAGKPVIIKSNGKATQVAQTTSLITTSLVNSASGILYLGTEGVHQKNSRLAYSPDDDLTVSTYVQDSGNLYHKAGLWQTSPSGAGQVQQLGSNAVIHSVGGNADGYTDICYLSSSRFVYVYNRNDTMKARLAVGTISGSGNSRTISWSNDQLLDGLSTSFYSSYKIRKIGTNRVAIFGVAGNTNCRWSDGTPGIIIGDVSSSTYTYRNSSILVSQNAANEFDRCDLAYNSTDDLLLAGWQRNSSNHYYRAIKVASGTSATITLTSSQFEISENNYKRNIVWHPTQNKFVLVYNQQASNNGEIDTRVFTVNSSSLAISVTSVYTLPNSGNKAAQGLFTLVTPQNSIQIKTIDNSRQPYTYADDSFNGTSFNIDREGKTSTGFDGNLEMCVQSVCLSEDPNQTIFSVYGSTSSLSNKPSAITVKSAEASTNLTTHNPIGFAPSAINDGATGTINCDGNTVTTSGLTAGTRYWIADNGTLATSLNTTHAGGVALSSTKLLIKMST